jgi:C_GCAxxG_C_C family probable redox protein
MSKIEKASSTFKEGFSCSQAVFSTFAKELEADENAMLKLSDAFGGGMRMALTCGAVTGAFMVIGLKYGRASADDLEAKQKTSDLVKEFVKKFEERHKSIACKELLGCDISTEEGLQYAKESNLTGTICPKLVADAVEILEEILQ